MKPAMSPGKVRKSFLKRFKLTKNNAILRRKSGISHFKVKQDKDSKREKRRFVGGNKNFIKYSIY